MSEPKPQHDRYPDVSQEEIDKSKRLEAEFQADAPIVGVDQLPLVPEIIIRLKGFAELVAPLNPAIPVRRPEGRLWERFFLPNENATAEDAYPSIDMSYRSPEGEPDKITIQYPHKKTPEEEALYPDPYGNGGPTRLETELERTDEGVRIKTMLWGSEDFPGRHIYGVWINDLEDCQRLLDFLEEAPEKLCQERPLSPAIQQAYIETAQELLTYMTVVDPQNRRN